MNPLPHGIHERLVDEYLRDVLARHPEFRAVLCQIDPKEQPARYASFVAKILEQALLNKAYELNPERFVRKPPMHKVMPEGVWIKPPKPATS